MNTKNDNSLHKEAILTKEFGKHLSSKYQYKELFEDKNTAGSDPFDSIGLIKNKIILIEYKNTISPGQVFYIGSKGSSIEKKIATVLKLIYSRQDSKTYNAIKEHITNTTVPLVWIVANGISKTTIQKLDNLLKERCIEWQFNYKVSMWKKEKEEILLSSSVEFDKTMSHEEIHIPVLPNTSKKRSEKLNKKKLNDIIEKIELSRVFEELISVFRELQLKPTYNIGNVNYSPNNGGYSLFGIWPKKSSKTNGLLLTISVEKINEHFGTKFESVNDLGLVRNNTKVGNLGYNSYLNSKTVVQEIKKRIAKASNI